MRTVLLAFALIALAAFALLNWPAFMAPTDLSLFVADVRAPLGLIMLIVTGLTAALFLVYIVFQQAGVIVEARRYARELKAQRELADKAEASRFTDLRAFVEAQVLKLEQQSGAAATAVAERLDRLEERVQQKLAESTNTLAACIGEVDDKLDRAGQLPR